MNSLPFTRGIRAITREPKYVRRRAGWIRLAAYDNMLCWYFSTSRSDVPFIDMCTSYVDVPTERFKFLATELIGEQEEDRAFGLGLFPLRQIIRPSQILAGLVSEVKLTPNTSYLELPLPDAKQRFIGFYRSGDLLEPCAWGFYKPETTLVYVPVGQCYPFVPSTWTNPLSRRPVTVKLQRVPKFRSFVREVL